MPIQLCSSFVSLLSSLVSLLCHAFDARSEYLWKDGVNYKKPTRVPAPVYIDLLLSWICVKIEDPVLFPVEQSQSHCNARTHTMAHHGHGRTDGWATRWRL